MHPWRLRLIRAGRVGGRAEERIIAHDPTSEAAADWVVRLASDDAGDADSLAFVAWLDLAPPGRPDLHREAFDRAQRLWLQADELNTIAHDAPRLLARPRHRRPIRLARWGTAAAACLAVAVVVGLWRWTPSRGPVSAGGGAVYATEPGQRRQVRLPDGSEVLLDGATTLALGPYEPAARSVTLVGGEAAFDIVHDPARPFTVGLGDARVRVLGTAFDVIRDPGLLQVSVARGQVAFDTPHRSVQLAAGRSATLAEGRVQVRDITPAEVADWRRGRRIYWGQPLTVVVADLNRAYPAPPIQLGDDAAGRVRFTGVLAAGTQAQTVRRLTELLPIQKTTGPRGAIVLRSSAP